MEYTVNIDNKGLPLLSIFIIIKKIIIMWHDKGNYNIMAITLQYINYQVNLL